MSTLGIRIKSLRIECNLSQIQLAKALGISNVQLSRYESGDRKPDPETLLLIANFLDVSTDYLLGRVASDHSENGFDPIVEIDKIIKENGMEQAAFYEIERWKALSPEEIKELESYFMYVTDKAKKKKEEEKS